MITFLVCLAIGVLLGRLGILGFALDNLRRWYQNKYGKFTAGDGRNYMQIFRTPVSRK